VTLPDSGISVGITVMQVLDNKSNGGGRGIRTPGTLSGTAVFKTACFNHSHITPRGFTTFYRVPSSERTLAAIGLSAGLNLCPVIRLLWSMFDTRLRLGTPPPQRHFTLTLLVNGVDRGDRRLRVRGFLPLKPNGDDIKKGASSAPNSKTV
jgi:hypothetical protein